jgi:hypothetical protein
VRHVEACRGTGTPFNKFDPLSRAEKLGLYGFLINAARSRAGRFDACAWRCSTRCRKIPYGKFIPFISIEFSRMPDIGKRFGRQN